MDLKAKVWKNELIQSLLMIPEAEMHKCKKRGRKRLCGHFIIKAYCRGKETIRNGFTHKNSFVAYS